MLWIRDTSQMRTPSAVPTAWSCVQIYLWIRDTSLWRIASWVPMLSSIERFHCMQDNQLGPNVVPSIERFHWTSVCLKQVSAVPSVSPPTSSCLPLYPDTDECAGEDHDCVHKCLNTVGSYYCDCNDGYTFSYNGVDCVGGSTVEVQESTHTRIPCTQGICLYTFS